MDSSSLDSVDKYQFLKKFLLSLAIGLWLYRLWIYRRFYCFALKFPGYLGPPFLGFFYKVSSLKDLIPEFTKLFVKCKSYTICLWFGMYPAVLTADPEIAEKVLSSPELLNKARPMYNSIDTWLENGIVTSKVEKWQKNRRLINPAFSHKVLLSFMPIFNKAKKLARMKLDDLVGQGEQQISKMLYRIALGVTVETTMGNVLQEGDQEEEKLAVKYSGFIKGITFTMMLSYIKADVIYQLLKGFSKTKAYLNSFVDKLIQQRIDAANRNRSEGISLKPVNDDDIDVEDEVSMKKTPNIFIDQMFKLYQANQFTWQDIVSESNTIVVGSLETTSSAIFFILTMLAMHPEVQEKLYEELHDMFPEKDFTLEYEHMQQLPYLDRVVNETLRLCPSIAIIGRQVEREMQLTKDLRLPKGLQLMISIFHLQRRPEIWGPDAEKFNPDHFLPENMEGKHSYAFIPFSKGSRNCIGWRYAIFSIKTMISGLVRNFRFTTSFRFEDIEFIQTINLQYHKEPGLEIHRR